MARLWPWRLFIAQAHQDYERPVLTLQEHQDYENPAYFPSLIDKWTNVMQKPPPNFPVQSGLLNCWAYSKEHPKLADESVDEDEQILLAYEHLVNLKTAVLADLDQKDPANGYSMYTVAFSPLSKDIQNRFGHSSPKRSNTKPKPKRLNMASDRAYRFQLVPLDHRPPNSTTNYSGSVLEVSNHFSLRCGEYVTLPHLVAQATSTPRRLVRIVCVSLSYSGIKAPFCPRCDYYAKTVTEQNPGLIIVDGCPNQQKVYQSLETVCSICVDRRFFKLTRLL